MSTQRDELAWEIFSIDNAAIADEALRLDFPQEAGYAQHIAEGLIAAGYSKPRTIAEHYGDEGIESLAACSAILSNGISLHLQTDGTWLDALGSSWDFWEISLPATILHEPTV